MSLTKIYANLSCSDLAASAAWFGKLFGRSPDARPMAGLAEWHHASSAGFQLHQNPDNAGRGTITLIVDDLVVEIARLGEEGIITGKIEEADYTSIVRLQDPDGNLVVLAQPKA
ncbi:VOC family protein (plasmid) [Rhizobium sp. TH2]|uniref:VOC family protein n=1 Tax=Rhizobium sp. TH2 TaxID=2775403 RepID=UPI00215717D5|nr:VOC family protein [Rhizobium sp. TH2]UVC12381.1 VOC family protein [Rhizobium sp. TH2]